MKLDNLKYIDQNITILVNSERALKKLSPIYYHRNILVNSEVKETKLEPHSSYEYNKLGSDVNVIQGMERLVNEIKRETPAI